MTTYRWPEGIARPAAPPRFTLVRSEDSPPLAVCAQVEGLFVDLPRRPYELIGCAPTGRLADALSVGPDKAELGDLWVKPVADEYCPEGSDRLCSWRLVDTRLFGHRPNAADAALVDVVIAAADDWIPPPEDPYLAVGIRLHDEREWLATCQDFVKVAHGSSPAESSGATFGVPGGLLRLVGCAAGDELAAALTAVERHSREFELVRLVGLDPLGAAATHWDFDAEIVGWSPSELGQDLVDLTLRWIPWDAPPVRARPIVERWLDGAPSAPNAWAQYDAWGREQWLTCVHRSGYARHHRPEQPPGGTYHLDGRYVTDRAAFSCALGEAVNGPGGYFGCDLGALAECLRGRFGATPPFTLVWHASDVARRHLSSFISPRDGEPYNYFDAILKIFSEGGIEVVHR